MTFLSGGFLLLVGALLIIYYVLPKRFRYLVLLGGSVVFYTLAGRAYLPFLGITVLTVYGTALLLGRSLERQKAYVAEHKKELTREAVAAYKKKESGKRTALFLLWTPFGPPGRSTGCCRLVSPSTPSNPWATSWT